jgi:predicted transposase YdaD
MMKTSNFIEEWIQEGWEKGREEGREEGWREGRITIILNLLKKILGRVSSELELKIRGLSDREIETLTYDLLDMKVLSDLEEWLKRREKNNQKN